MTLGIFRNLSLMLGWETCWDLFRSLKLNISLFYLISSWLSETIARLSRITSKRGFSWIVYVGVIQGFTSTIYWQISTIIWKVYIWRRSSRSKPIDWFSYKINLYTEYIIILKLKYVKIHLLRVSWDLDFDLLLVLWEATHLQSRTVLLKLLFWSSHKWSYWIHRSC